MSPVAEAAEDSLSDVAERARRYNDLGRHAEAERILRRALRSHPENIQFLSRLAFTLYRQKRYDDALEVLGEALSLDPDEPVLYFHRGRTLWELERHDEAIETVLRGLDSDPYAQLRMYLCQTLGFYYNREKRHPEALAIVEQALVEFPGDPRLLDVAGEALRRQDRLHEADEYYAASLAVDPLNADVRYGKALNDMNLGRAKESLAGFARSMQLDPEDGWKAERVRYFMSWPVSNFSGSFRWAVPLAAVAALFNAAAAGPAWRWIGLALLLGCFGYAVNWLHRGGRASWTALARLRPLDKLAMALSFLATQLGVAAVMASLLTGDAVTAWLGLATGLLIWPALGFEYALDPNEDREKSLPRRALNQMWWCVNFDFTRNPPIMWRRLRHRLARHEASSPDPLPRRDSV